MIVGIAGPAGSGKDTVAEMFCKHAKAVAIAQADPMKRFCARVFGFTEHQLWGPSEARNAPDERFNEEADWVKAFNVWNVDFNRGGEWLRELDFCSASALIALAQWFDKLVEDHGFRRTITGFVKQHGIFRKLTPRYTLQTLGTEFGRTVSSTVWNDYALKVAKRLFGGGHDYARSFGLVPEEAFSPDFALITDVRFRNEFVGIRSQGGIVVTVEPSAVDNAAIEAGVPGHQSERELGSIPRHWSRYIICNDKEEGLDALEKKVERLVYDLKFETWERL